MINSITKFYSKAQESVSLTCIFSIKLSLVLQFREDDFAKTLALLYYKFGPKFTCLIKIELSAKVVSRIFPAIYCSALLTTP